MKRKIVLYVHVHTVHVCVFVFFVYNNFVCFYYYIVTYPVHFLLLIPLIMRPAGHRYTIYMYAINLTKIIS